MSLHDRDNSTDNRSNPQLSAADALPNDTVKAHATDGIAYRESGATGVPYVVSKDDQLIVFDGSTNIALLGRDGDGNYVVKIAKQGFDVLTATNDQLVFNSENNTFKIVATGTVNLGTNSGGAPNVVDVAHGLSSAPTAIGFATVTDATNGTRTVPLPHYTLGSTSGISSAVRVVTAYVTMETNNTNVRFILAGPAISTSATVRYYILQETAV